MSMNPHNNPAPDHEILDVFEKRYSPYLYEPRAVEPEKIRRCLEAARWAPSSYNEQPWSFILARREEPDEFAKILSCLTEANREWAQNAGVVMLTVVRRRFTLNEQPNRVAEHDVGLAAGFLTIQATTMGLQVHQMAGVLPERAREIYAIPEPFDVLTGIAIGYAGDPNATDHEEFARRDLAPKPRKPLSEFVFTGRWGERSPIVAKT